MITDLVPEVGALSDREKHLVAADRRALAAAARMATAAQRIEQLKISCSETDKDEQLIKLILAAWQEDTCRTEELYEVFNDLVARDFAGRYRKAPHLAEMVEQYPDFVTWLEGQNDLVLSRYRAASRNHADTCNCNFCR